MRWHWVLTSYSCGPYICHILEEKGIASAFWFPYLAATTSFEKKYTVLLMSCLIAVRSISSTKQKDEAEVKKEIQSVIRQITASVTFLPLIECPCMWLLLCFEITISTILTSTVGNTCLILQLLRLTRFPSVLWHCWLGGRKGIRPVKNWVVGCWCGCLSGARC